MDRSQYDTILSMFLNPLYNVLQRDENLFFQYFLSNPNHVASNALLKFHAIYCRNYEPKTLIIFPYMLVQNIIAAHKTLYRVQTVVLIDRLQFVSKSQTVHCLFLRFEFVHNNLSDIHMSSYHYKNVLFYIVISNTEYDF